MRPERRHGGGGAAAGEPRRERPGCGRGPRGAGSLLHAAGAPSSGRGPETRPPAPARSVLSPGPGLRYTSQGRAEHGGESFRSPENVPKSPPSDSEPPVRPAHEHVRIRSQGHRDGPQSFLKSVLPRGTVRPWESVWKAKGGRGGTLGPALGGEEVCARGGKRRGEGPISAHSWGCSPDHKGMWGLDSRMGGSGPTPGREPCVHREF